MFKDQSHFKPRLRLKKFLAGRPLRIGSALATMILFSALGIAAAAAEEANEHSLGAFGAEGNPPLAEQGGPGYQPPAPPLSPSKGRLLTLGIGVQGSYVHSFQFTPNNAPYDDQAGKEGSGGGGGLTVQARGLRYLELETGLLLEKNTRKKKISIVSSQITADYYPTVIATNLRIPFILKGVLPFPVVGPESGSFWLGGGPELVLARSARGEMDYEFQLPSGYRVSNPETAEEVALLYSERIRKRNAVHLTGGFGFRVRVAHTEVGLGIRASWNPSHENEYMAAVCGPNTYCRGEEHEYSEHSLDVRATLGVTYLFPLY